MFAEASKVVDKPSKVKIDIHLCTTEYTLGHEWFYVKDISKSCPYIYNFSQPCSSNIDVMLSARE